MLFRSMADISAKVTGGSLEIFEDVNTVSELISEMGLEGNYTAMINGSPADLSDSLTDDDFVSLTKSVKGGC